MLATLRIKMILVYRRRPIFLFIESYIFAIIAVKYIKYIQQNTSDVTNFAAAKVIVTCFLVILLYSNEP